MIVLKCALIIAALIIVWLFGYMVGVKIAIKYAVEKTEQALTEVVEENDSQEAYEFADKLVNKIKEIF